MAINLDDQNDVQRGVSSLLGSVRPYLNEAMPWLKLLAPIVEKVTGYSFDELNSALGQVSDSTGDYPEQKRRESGDIYNKYKNL